MVGKKELSCGTVILGRQSSPIVVAPHDSIQIPISRDFAGCMLLTSLYKEPIGLFARDGEFSIVGSTEKAQLLLLASLSANAGKVVFAGIRADGTLLSYGSSVGDFAVDGLSNALRRIGADGQGIFSVEPLANSAAVRTSLAAGLTEMANFFMSGNAALATIQVEGFIVADDDEPTIDAGGETIYVERAHS